MFCYYYPKAPNFLLSLAASNYTMEMLKKLSGHWGIEEYEIGGRRALATFDAKPPRTDICSISVAATTGVYGVLITGFHDDFTPYPDCKTAARTNMEALLPYLPL